MNVKIHRPKHIVVVHPDTIKPVDNSLNIAWVQNMLAFIQRDTAIEVLTVLRATEQEHPVVNKIHAIADETNLELVQEVVEHYTLINKIRKNELDNIRELFTSFPYNEEDLYAMQYVVVGTSIGHCVPLVATSLHALKAAVIIPVALTNGHQVLQRVDITTETLPVYFPNPEVQLKWPQIQSLLDYSPLENL